MRVFVTVTLLAAFAGSAADAQQSLFDQKPMNDTVAAPTVVAAPKPRPKPKPRGPIPARVLQISNDGTTAVTTLEVAGEGKTVQLAKPLGPNTKVSLKLPVLKTCAVTITTTFDGNPLPDTTEQDICKDKGIRFTD